MPDFRTFTTPGSLARALFTLFLALAACTPSRAADGAFASNRDALSQADIRSSDASTLYEVVNRLRPQWLRTGGQRSFGLPTEVLVYQNGAMLGGVDVLHRIGTEAVYGLRYVDGTTASNTLPGAGSRHVAGAIIVVTTPP